MDVIFQPIIKGVAGEIELYSNATHSTYRNSQIGSSCYSFNENFYGPTKDRASLYILKAKSREYRGMFWVRSPENDDKFGKKIGLNK